VPALDVSLTDQPKPGFVDEGGRLERMAGALAPQVCRCQSSQLPVDDARQFVARALIPRAPGVQQARDSAGAGFRHRPSVSRDCTSSHEKNEPAMSAFGREPCMYS